LAKHALKARLLCSSNQAEGALLSLEELFCQIFQEYGLYLGGTKLCFDDLYYQDSPGT
jgi:hypothetical protein